MPASGIIGRRETRLRAAPDLGAGRVIMIQRSRCGRAARGGRHAGRQGRRRRVDASAGLTADTQDELHAFAARLGIRGDPGTPGWATAGAGYPALPADWRPALSRGKARSASNYSPWSGQDETAAGGHAGRKLVPNLNCQLGNWTDHGRWSYWVADYGTWK